MKTYQKISKKDTITILKYLEKEYGDAKCGLDFASPLQLVVALILAAQCTDARVNQIVPILFAKFPDVYALANASIEEIAEIIKPCGFYKNKSISISQTANILIQNFNGKVPDTMEKLCTLRGIGRKSSNIILQECFHHVVGIAVDTHVTRLSRKMGISNAHTPEKIEEELTSKIPHSYWAKINHIFVLHGRAVCIARRPQCQNCVISSICPKND